MPATSQALTALEPLYRTPHPRRRMTEQEFIDWCDSDTWAEWVEGEVIVMSAVHLPHARTFSFFLTLVRVFVEEGDLGEVLTEPFQVRFGRQRRRRSPDIFFVSKARSAIIKERHVEGPPDLIVEIVSPESEARDWREKYLEYQAAGVREYWVIDPLSRMMEVYALSGKRYRRIDPVRDRIHSIVLPGFHLRPQWLWQTPLPKVTSLLREMRAAKHRQG